MESTTEPQSLKKLWTGKCQIMCPAHCTNVHVPEHCWPLSLGLPLLWGGVLRPPRKAPCKYNVCSKLRSTILLKHIIAKLLPELKQLIMDIKVTLYFQ